MYSSIPALRAFDVEEFIGCATSHFQTLKLLLRALLFLFLLKVNFVRRRAWLFWTRPLRFGSFQFVKDLKRFLLCCQGRSLVNLSCFSPRFPQQSKARTKSRFPSVRLMGAHSSSCEPTASYRHDRGTDCRWFGSCQTLRPRCYAVQHLAGFLLSSDSI